MCLRTVVLTGVVVLPAGCIPERRLYPFAFGQRGRCLVGREQRVVLRPHQDEGSPLGIWYPL